MRVCVDDRCLTKRKKRFALTGMASMVLLMALSGEALCQSSWSPPSAVQQTPAVDVFCEDFSDNLAGWTLGTEWQIGPAMFSSGQSLGDSDPAVDTSPTSDNGVAGTVIGGNMTPVTHAPYYLTSPVIDTSATVGALSLQFQRWLNIDFPPFSTSTIEVFNGTDWTTVYATGAGFAVTDSAWHPISINIAPYRSAMMRVRFSHGMGMGTGNEIASGWNLDDICVVSGSVIPALIFKDGYE